MQDSDMNQPQQPVDPTHIPSQWAGDPIPSVSSGTTSSSPGASASATGPDYPSSPGAIGGPSYGGAPSATSIPTYPGSGGPGGPAYPGGTGGTGGGFAPRPQISFDVIGEAWGILQKQMGVWIPAMLIVALIQGVIYAIMMAVAMPHNMTPISPTPGNPFPTSAPPTFSPLFPVFGLVLGIVGVTLTGGLYRMAIKQFRGQPPSIGDLFSATDAIVPLLMAGVLMYIATLLGACACGVGALVVTGLLMFTIPLIVDKGMGAIEAMSTSWNTLKGEWLMATVFYLVISIVASSGGILCGIGILVTAPLALLSMAVLYRNYFLGSGAPIDAPGTGSYPPPPIPSARY